MSIDKQTVSQAIDALSSVREIWMEAEALVEDAAYLTLSFPEPEDYKAAIANTVKAFRDISKDCVSTDKLSGSFVGWESYHYQPKVGQGVAADMRIIFKRESDQAYVLGFGHRFAPSDFYTRVSRLRKGRHHS